MERVPGEQPIELGTKAGMQGTLDQAIAATGSLDVETIANQSAVTTELQKERLLKPTSSDRVKSRVLFVSEDVSLLEPESSSRTFILQLASYFSEIHVIVSTKHSAISPDGERIAPNIWLYGTSYRYWWQAPWAVKRRAEEALQFGNGFRPDLIVAINPFEAGLGAYLIATAYDRPFQVHLTKSYWMPEYAAHDPLYKWRRRIATYVLKRTASIRTINKHMADHVKRQFPQIADLAVLPRYHDLAALISLPKSTQETSVFPHYNFVMLCVSKLMHNTPVYRALDAARHVLINPGTVLVIIGDGPAKAELQARAKILGIETQVVFKPYVDNLVDYMRDADVLIVPDTSEAGDELVIKAAAVGLPLVMAETELRKDLFADGSDAFLCDPEDTYGLGQKLSQFINNSSLRLQFSQSAKTIVHSRLEEDPETYRRSYVASVEQAFNVQEEK